MLIKTYSLIGGVGATSVALLADLGYDVVAVTGKADDATVEWLKKLGAKEVNDSLC